MTNIHLPPGLSAASFNLDKVTELDTNSSAFGASASKLSSSEETTPWMEFTQMRHYTNAFVVMGDKILLGMKKRGIGEGMWNGFGGKVEPGETNLEAAYRELKEECGIEIPLVHAGRLLFCTETVPGMSAEIEVYRSSPDATEYVGELAESDEMRPQWFDLDSIPYDLMWDGDIFWLPILIEGQKRFLAREDFALDKGDGEARGASTMITVKGESGEILRKPVWLRRRWIGVENTS